MGSNDGRFYVLGLNNGAKLWEFNAGAPLSASPAIANGRIVIGHRMDACIASDKTSPQITQIRLSV